MYAEPENESNVYELKKKRRKKTETRLKDRLILHLGEGLRDLGPYSQRFFFLELVLFLEFFLELSFFLEKF